METFVARAVGVEEHPPLLLVGFAEREDGTGQAFHFQCDLRVNDYSEDDGWPEDDTYCMSTEKGLTKFGCVEEVGIQGNVVKISFTAAAQRDLSLKSRVFEIHIEGSDVSTSRIVRELHRVLTCGRPEYHPDFLIVDN
ncbi:hypothetical protein GCM10010182_46350 [Actinomadura cremea]|nr:hypothetical protein GCM10010182_46350 [Actinomadura cremea]